MTIHSCCLDRRREGVSVRPRLAVFDMIGTTVHAGPEVSEAFREAFEGAGVTLSAKPWMRCAAGRRRKPSRS